MIILRIDVLCENLKESRNSKVHEYVRGANDRNKELGCQVRYGSISFNSSFGSQINFSSLDIARVKPIS